MVVFQKKSLLREAQLTHQSLVFSAKLKSETIFNIHANIKSESRKVSFMVFVYKSEKNVYLVS